MSKKKKKNPFTRLDRGPTFVGFSPSFGPTKKEKLEKSRKKHKKDLTKEGLSDNI